MLNTDNKIHSDVKNFINYNFLILSIFLFWFVYSSFNFSINIPVFSENVLDTMGAGDAFLSITTPLVAVGAPMEVVGFVGNAVGAMAVTIIGNKEPIDKASLFKYITSIMK